VLANIPVASVVVCRAKLGAKCVKRKSISVKNVHVLYMYPARARCLPGNDAATGTAAVDRVVKKVSRAAGKKSGRVTLVGRYMNAMFSSLGFLLVGVEIAEFEFTACIRYRFTNPMCLQRA